MPRAVPVLPRAGRMLGALTLLMALVTTTAPAQQRRSAVGAKPATPDSRIGLNAGRYDAGEAAWNMRIVSTTKSPPRFEDGVNSDLAFTGKYAIQGNFNGFMVWDISNPGAPVLTTEYFCPASQSDVSVYKHLLFVSGEGMEGRLDCAEGGVPTAISGERLRGIRIFDISDIKAPKYVGNVQTCRGSHTHSVLVDPNDKDFVYVYVSGSAPVRPEIEMPGCSAGQPGDNPGSAMFRIEVIKVPLANPRAAAIVASPRIFEGLEAPPVHGSSPADMAELATARAAGKYVATIGGEEMVLPDGFANQLLGQMMAARGGTGTPTAADSAALRTALPSIVAQMMGGSPDDARGPRPGPNQCHDITLSPALGLAGGACEGYGILLDISDPANPQRLDAVADSNFAYWHSATFNNDGTTILFTDEWGGGGGPKCRAGDPKEWGANALFTLKDGKMTFASYYKLPVVQTSLENCVAHNGSLIPVPGRDIMVQAWYQGGISIFDFTDPAKPFEIAFHDRGPLNPDEMQMAGSWSVYWYNGIMVSSEIARGLDIFDLVANPLLTQNEIDAAKSVRFAEFNAQMQPKFTWTPSFAVARAYLDQLERDGGLASGRIRAIRSTLTNAERATGAARSRALEALATRVATDATGARDGDKVRSLAETIRGI